MKKRIRKKLHLKEFAEYGCFFVLDCNPEETEQVFDKIETIIKNYDAKCWGGGNGNFIMPDCDPDYVLPTFLENITMWCAFDAQPGMVMICLTSPDKKTLPTEVETDIRETFADVRYNLKINPRVNLWPRPSKRKP